MLFGNKGDMIVASISTSNPDRWIFQSWFRFTFTLVGGVEVIFGILTLCQGVKQFMSQFGIPESVVSSPHYIDAMTWVVLHMTFLGSILVVLGTFAREQRLQRCLTWLVLPFHFVYAFLDVRSSDSPLGTALYQGNMSLFPAVVSCSFFLLFLNLAFRSYFISGGQTAASITDHIS
jgi:uncharacterized membrane protein YphA (DoxX/SURF4 family)